VVAQQDMHHDLTDIYWLNPEGEVVRHEQPRLRGGFYMGGEQPAWQTAVALPSPLLCAINFAVTRPQQSVAVGRFADFQDALAASLAEAWPAFLVVLVLSAVLAVAGYRRHVRYGQPFAIAWASFVVLGGPAGWIGYLLHRHWPAIERCGQYRALWPMWSGSSARSRGLSSLFGDISSAGAARDRDLRSLGRKRGNLRPRLGLHLRDGSIQSTRRAKFCAAA